MISEDLLVTVRGCVRAVKAELLRCKRKVEYWDVQSTAYVICVRLITIITLVHCIHAYRISYRISYNYILFKTQICKYRQISQGRCFYQVVDFNPTTFFSEPFRCNATPHCITSAQVPCCSFWWRDGHCAKSCTGREEHRWKSMENPYKIDGTKTRSAGDAGDA